MARGIGEEKLVVKESIGNRLFGLLAFVFVCFCGALLIWQSSSKIRQWFNADQLVESRALVVDTYILDNPKSNNKTGAQWYDYQAMALAELAVDGKNYSSQLELASCPHDRQCAEQALRRFPENKTVTVFYNPKNPKEIHLSNDLPLLGPLVSFLLGLLFILPFLSWLYSKIVLHISQQRGR